MGVLGVAAPLAWLGPGRLVDDALVIAEGGRVVYAGPAADAPLGELPELDEAVEVDGFLIPAVADRHVHIGFADPAAVLAGGVTAVRDLGWPAGEIVPLADASESPSFRGPLVRAAGPMITCPGGYPTRAAWAPPGTGVEVRGPEEAAATVPRLLERTGSAFVKVALNADAGPTLDDRELVAVCDAAHERGAIVTVHCQGRGQVERALGAGADELAHAPWSERLADDLVEAVARTMRVVSTLDIHARGDGRALALATENLARVASAGGTIVYGTDLGNGPIPAGIHAGEALHLRRAGLSPEEVLVAMTFRPLAAGEPADLVALAGDPHEDLAAVGRVHLVLRAGRLVR